jgi:hypothetical protein
VLVLLGILEGDRDGAAHVVILIVDWQLDLLLPTPDLVVLLVLPRVEFDVYLHPSGQSSEERAQLSSRICTIGFITQK